VVSIASSFFTVELLIYTYLFNLKGRHPLRSIKPISVCKDFANKLCGINVAPAANSVYRCANFKCFIYTSKPISAHSYIPVLSTPASVA
jgi:hypothetical protein